MGEPDEGHGGCLQRPTGLLSGIKTRFVLYSLQMHPLGVPQTHFCKKLMRALRICCLLLAKIKIQFISHVPDPVLNSCLMNLHNSLRKYMCPLPLLCNKHLPNSGA